MADETRTVAARKSATSVSSSTADDSRFLPGEILAERYRIISLLGAGGMGEVYRATDLKLGQPVALKFLPPAPSQDAIERFRGEVRLARSISHPNVCRVYDIGEVAGQTYLSMEYVDGEDLASLLRRIGRLPHDKAIDIARQICAGLAAAHDRSILHRDLKPGNILIDGRGVARIADFGLAAAEEIRAGTPAYMAPEQLAGREVTVRSDIYALGLVLYELFTGKRAVNVPGEVPEPPSTVVDGIDDAVDAAIARCLEADPAARPSSAVAVSAMLPGGDPLAAALAAGETPSPAMVAAAGEQTGLRMRTAVLLLTGTLAGLGMLWYMRTAGSMLNHADLELPPAVLQHRARELMTAMGYADRPVDTASGFFFHRQYLAHRQKHANVRYPAAAFWYRENPEPLVNTDPMYSGVTVGAVNATNPPVVRPGMSSLTVDPRGRLINATIRPPDKVASADAAFDWRSFLAQAGYDPAQLTEAQPEWLPPVGFARRVAWTGDTPLANVPLRIEAAELAGKVVSFRVIAPWIEADTGRPSPRSASDVINQTISNVLIIAAVLGAAAMARIHVLSGKGDRKAALRIAAAMLALHLAGVLLGADHTLNAVELNLLALAVATGLLKAALVWLGYMAVEPLVRRRLPHALVSWTRVTSGRWRDPLVGRDLLIGLLAGVTVQIMWTGCSLLQQRLGAPYWITTNSTEALRGLRQTLALLPNETTEALLQASVFFLLFFLCRLVVRRDWAAVVVASVLLASQNYFAGVNVWLNVVFFTGALLLLFAVSLRVGLMGILAALWVVDLTYAAPATLNFDLWFAPYAAIIFGLFTVAALVSFRVATGARRLL
ncbi:MAG TPA: serine/threonine-protein kinase [Bryobacteraceae bacterium]|nr:serine/threonine-protein kinase [Bryobacteraceae bacterium]